MDWTEKWLDRQIDLYVKVERPRYEAYADFLGSVLGRTCEKVAPLAMVQVRTKAPASFAEKCVRQFDEHPNPVYQLTDLCGGRIIAQSSDQVDQFCGFIRQHFIVDAANSEDVQERLRTSEFGYRSVHFVVQVPEQIAQTLGLTRQEQSLLKKLNGDGGAGTRMRKAEIQVRTQIQHVWADNAHDRFYKTRLRLPREYRREVARLAALLEAADNSFGDIMRKVDAYQVDYGAYMTQEVMQSEIHTLKSIIGRKGLSKDRHALALRIAKVAKAAGDWDATIATAGEFVDGDNPNRDKLRLELGYALCRKNEDRPDSEGFLQGQRRLRQVAQSGREAGVRIGEAEETRALALANLAWSIRRARTRDVLSEARDLYRQAHLAVPDNPYHFAGFLECEALERRSVGFVDLLLSQVDAAVERCEEHARVGIELPYAYFTIARLHLLAGRTHQGLLAFAKAIHRSSSEYPIEQELASILDLQDLLISPGSATQNGLEMARKLLVLGKAAKLLLRDAESGALEELDALFCEAQAGEGDGVRTLMRRHALNVPRPFVIVAGGADPSLEDRWSQYEPMLRDALADFEGSLFSGGTRTGIPGMLGKIAGTSRAAGAKTRCLIGYIPRRLPVDGLLDQRYHEHVVTDGDRFSQLEPLQNWIDILGAGVCPRDVRVLGINGGEIAKFEYYLGLALGATVGLVESSGRSASLLLEEDPWWEETQLLRLPEDAMTIRAFLAVEPGSWGQQDPGIQMPNLEKAARRIHENHQRSSLEDWDSLREDFRRSNLHQAAYSVNILQAAGLKIRRKAKARIEVLDLEKAIGRRRLRELATMEHGRWNVERLLQGWSYGAEKDEEGRLSPYLVPWKELSREIQQYDIDAVANFPQVLREAGLEVYG